MAAHEAQPRGRAPWTEEDDRLVLMHDVPDKELSEHIGRSVHAIQNRRGRLKKEGWEQMKKGSTVAGNAHDGVLRWLGDSTFEGSIRLSNGRFDHRRFFVENDARRVRRAIEQWEQWKSEVRQGERQKMRERARGHDDRDGQPVVIEVRAEKKEVDVMASSNEAASPGKARDTAYVVMVVGGAPIFVVDDFDRAASVCDALDAGAKASGFSAKYDVVEVKRWAV